MRKTSLARIFPWIVFGGLAALALYSLLFAFQINPPASQDFLTLVSEVLLGLLPIEFAFMAALILARQPNNAIGWLLMLPAVALAPDRAFSAYFGRLTSAPPDPSPVFLLSLWFSGLSWLLLIFPVFFIMLLFPTGKPASPRWRWVTYYVLGVAIYFFIVLAFQHSISIDLAVRNPLGIIPDDWFGKYLWVTFGFGLLTTTLLSIASLIMRYRRALAVEREQIKWLCYVCVWFAAVYLLAIFSNLPSEGWGTPSFFNLLFPLALMAIPAAIAGAILRYRLFDIDLIIRKTLVYGALTVTLGLVFFGGVALLQGAFGALTGTENSPVAIVLSTLAIAALFNPLRKRVQDFIDRRFYRKKYNAEQALARFAATARGQTDIEQLSAELVAVVRETIQPEQISIWLKKGSKGNTAQN